MSLLIRFWDREHDSLSSHVLTSFYIKFSFIHIFHMWKLHKVNTMWKIQRYSKPPKASVKEPKVQKRDPPYMHLLPL